MTTAKEYFRKQGGFGLLKQYWRAGVLGTAIAQFVLLGSGKTALELLRMSVSLKTKQRLKRKYKSVIDECEYNGWEKLYHKESRTIWIFWWQGMEQAPQIVQRCYASIVEHLAKDWNIVLLTELNFREYADFPQCILEKLNKGIITLTHFSDLLRLELLIRHGGLWLDATVFCTNSEIPQSILKSDLFVYQTQKPGADGKAMTMSSWMMWARSNNNILLLTQKLLYKYWEKNTYLVDYFLLHHFFAISCEHFEEEARKIPPFDNSIPHLLLLHLFDEYDENQWLMWKQQTCFHKLSYKFENDDKNKGLITFYKKILEKV